MEDNTTVRYNNYFPGEVRTSIHKSLAAAKAELLDCREQGIAASIETLEGITIAFTEDSDMDNGWWKDDLNIMLESRILEFNQTAELPIANMGEGEEETFKAGRYSLTIVAEYSDTITFMWEGLLFEEVPKVFFLDFED